MLFFMCLIPWPMLLSFIQTSNGRSKPLPFSSKVRFIGSVVQLGKSFRMIPPEKEDDDVAVDQEEEEDDETEVHIGEFLCSN